MRHFANTARIPASPLWRIAIETAERTAESWKSLEQADALPQDLKDSIGSQILCVAASSSDKVFSAHRLRLSSHQGRGDHQEFWSEAGTREPEESIVRHF
jgi:hypothetical protein